MVAFGRRAVAGLLGLAALAACQRNPPPGPREVETRLEARGGLFVPGAGFLTLETWERDLFDPAPGATSADLDLYRGVALAGVELPAGTELPIRSHRKLAATSRLLLQEPGGGLPVPVVSDLLRYDYAVCQGLLRRSREEFLTGARGWQAGKVALLPLWAAGAAEEEAEWVVLYLENGALTTLPRPGGAARSLRPPLPAASVTRSRPDRRVVAALAPAGVYAAALTRAGEIEVVRLDGASLASPGLTAWDLAWHPRLPRLYLASERGVERLDVGAAAALPIAADLPGGARVRALMASPDGTALLLFPAGATQELFALPLGPDGRPSGPPRPLPPCAARADARVWEPGGHVLWCFQMERGRAWRVDASTGALLGRWSWPASLRLDAAEGGETPTVTLRYPSAGYPRWQLFTAFLDPATLKFTGLTEKSPLEGIEWAPVRRGGEEE